ncbi:MAG: LacI family transcriptional regulator [Bacteroidetes bacterium]|nr:MAG: LacI family transcriptional regulator [Bacteroidota bacterium]
MGKTIKDVARNAGVSISTVSRVFNNTAFVDEPTRQKVLLSAKELRYSPNQAARSLTKSETRTIGLILPGVFGEYFSEVLRGMDMVAANDDFDIIISSSKNVRAKFEKSIRAMAGRVDGLVVMSPLVIGPELRDLIPADIPVVLLNSPEQHPSFDTVNINNAEGAFVAVHHLIRLGHRRIAIIKGLENSYDARQRYEGYRTAMETHGLGTMMRVAAGAYTIPSGRTAAAELLASGERPTALFVSNDAMAVGAMEAIAEQGLSVPRDIAVVGFDDIPMSQYAKPPLTTIRVDLHLFGETAMKRIVAAVRDKQKHRTERMMVGFELIVRQSCGS